MKKLVLSKIGMSTQGALDLTEAITKMANLEHIDISFNFINDKCFTYMFREISRNNCLKSVDISSNNAKSASQTS